MSLLELHDVTVCFGAMRAVDSVSLHVDAGLITAVIGPNGAGKTTLFDAVSGHVSGASGTALFAGQHLLGRPPHRVARLGLSRTFQTPRLFANMTVLENMIVAAPNQIGETAFASLWRRKAVREQEDMIRERARELLEFLELADVAQHAGDELSGGQQKLLEIGRALMTQPTLVLLDEPVAGVNPTLAAKIGHKLRQLLSTNVSFLLIEHDMEFVMENADWVYVLAQGQVIAEGEPLTIRKNPEVLDAYLGRR